MKVRFALAPLAAGFVALSAPAQTLIGADWNTGQLFALSTTNAAATPLGSTATNWWFDLEYAQNGTLYATRAHWMGSGYQLDLHTIDPVSGAAPLVTNTNLLFVSEGDIALSPAGEMWVSSADGLGSHSLYVLDPATGLGTLGATILGDYDISGMTWRGDGMLLLLNSFQNTFEVLDPTSGQIVSSQVLTPALGNLNGMVSVGDVVYFTTAGPLAPIPGSNELWRLDPYTGVHSLVGSLSGIVTGEGMSGLAFRGCAPALAYCTAGTSSNGCAATMSSQGSPSITASSGFVLTAANLDGQRSALIFYGTSGTLSLPWSASSSSFLCVKPPTQRTPVQSTGGTAFACDGSLALDWLAFLAANPSALGQPFASGETVFAQTWYRDPPSQKSTSLSDALRFTTCP